VGGVSGRPARAHARCCNGGRHPGPRDADGLRGSSEKRGSWSVRSGCVGLVPMQSIAPMTTGVLWKNEEGNVVSVRISARTLRVRRPKSGSRNEDTSFARSRDPCTSRAEHSSTPAGQLAGGGGVGPREVEISRSGKPGSPGGTGTGVTIPRTKLRGSPRLTALRGNPERSCVRRQKRKVVMAIVPARKRESRIFRPYVVSSCRSRQAASWSRISTYAALQKEWRYE